MKKIIMLLCGMFPVLCYSQKSEEISFSNASWPEILAMAKRENKNIFVDAYTTWCVPCKKMEEEIYTNPRIANYANQSFINVKIQFDQTKKDGKDIQEFYSTAKQMQEKYKIVAFPTFLFINACGELVYKEVGYQDTTDFLTILQKANDPVNNFSGKLTLFNQGLLAGHNLLMFAINAKQTGQDGVAWRAAKNYKETVIDGKLPKTILGTDLFLYFINFYDQMSLNDEVIKFMYKNPIIADSLLNSKGYSLTMTDYLIGNRYVTNIIMSEGNYITTVPNWNKIEKCITLDYDKVTAERILLESKLAWFMHKQDWPNVVKIQIQKTDKEGINLQGLGGTNINNMVYKIIFKHSTDPIALRRAADYMEVLLKSEPESQHWLDTYANVLYKLGDKEKALQVEEKALTLAIETKNEANIEFYKDVINKIKNDIPTW